MFQKVALAVVVYVCAGAAVAQNVLVNPGFETGSLAPWFADFGSPFVTSSEAHSGLFSAAGFGGDSIRQDFAPVPAASIDEVSVWIKRAGGAFDQYSFYYDDNTSGTFLINDIGGGDDWKQHFLTANLDLSKNLTGFSIFGTSSGPAYMDDFIITPSPGAAALLGLGGLMTVRRRR